MVRPYFIAKFVLFCKKDPIKFVYVKKMLYLCTLFMGNWEYHAPKNTIYTV